MKEWFDAVAAHEKALGEFNGYSWGYHGYEYIQRMVRAQEEFEKALNAIIDARVAAATAELQS